MASGHTKAEFFDIHQPIQLGPIFRSNLEPYQIEPVLVARRKHLDHPDRCWFNTFSWCIFAILGHKTLQILQQLNRWTFLSFTWNGTGWPDLHRTSARGARDKKVLPFVFRLQKICAGHETRTWRAVCLEFLKATYDVILLPCKSYVYVIKNTLEIWT